MPSVQITRVALLARKSRLTLTEQARKLLEEKQTVLLREIRAIADQVLDDTQALGQISNRARYALAQAEAVAGEESIRSAALATSRYFPLEFQRDNVMGVQVPGFRIKEEGQPVFERGYALTNTSLLIDEAAETAEAEVRAIVQLANSELRLKRLLSEYQRTSRRLNALEHQLIPRIRSEIHQIEMALAERERTDYYRLKLAKRLVQRKR